MLRERIPDFVPALTDNGAGVVVPRMREPVVAAFRSGGDLGSVCEMIARNKMVSVEAAPGAGKSTVLPARLAQELQSLVLHVFPNERLAHHVGKYIYSIGVQHTLMLSPSDPYPPTGLVLVPAPVLVAKWLEAGTPVLPDCVIYHDESHECDAYTYVVKTLGPACVGVRSYVSTTATPGASGFRSFEPKGKLAVGVYEGPATSWDPYDVGKPWGMGSLRGNALLFVDSKTAAAGLVEAYGAAGFMAYRLQSRMSLADFDVIATACADPNGPIVVMVADSSFRSGFTFDVTTIIDSGRIGYVDTSTGRPVRRERGIYEVESFQARARGARLDGQSTGYWFPDGVQAERAICDLAPVEMEAAALVLRMLGYSPPRELSGCVMAQGDVPRDLCLALQRDQPLALINADNKVPLSVLATPAGRRSPFLAEDVVDTGRASPDFVDSRISADTARNHGEQRYVKSGIARSQWQESWQDDLREMMAVKPEVRELKTGRAYAARGLATDQDESIVFPDGADSVLRLMSEHEQHGALASLDSWHKSVAVNLLITRQGALAAEMDGIGRAIKFARSIQGAAGTPMARKLALRVAERLAVVSSSSAHVNDVLMHLGKGFCSYDEIEVNRAVSDSVFEDWVTAWKALPSVSNRDRLEQGFGVARDSARASHVLASHVKPMVSDREYVPMPARGGAMRAIRSAIVSASSSRHGSKDSVGDERCTGSTYWRQSIEKTSDGGLVSKRRLVCEFCGDGASKRKHGVKV